MEDITENILVSFFSDTVYIGSYFQLKTSIIIDRENILVH